MHFVQRWVFHAIQAIAIVGLLWAIFGTPDFRLAALVAALIASTIMFFGGIAMGRSALDQLATHRAMFQSADLAHRQMGELFDMTDMLQSADGHDDAGAVLMATSQRLLPEFSGALYVFNNSRDRLDLARSWNATPGFTPAATLMPGNCWALKRGKPHINDPITRTLCCMHHIGEAATVEVPMMARGQVYGLLVLGTEEGGGHERLTSVRRLTRALADSMSLALSNITLREKLRTQSLRDPLTGLYNRRYMEDALDRYVSLAERTGSSTAVIMIDLDNFKRLNDESGHAKGDAVLRDVAAQFIGALRPSDVVARYGGEELMVILPGCGMDDALLKAEILRARVESLSEVHGVPVSASFGVAAVPETSTSPADVVPMADAALYAAKQAGKNCIRTADRRAGRDNGQIKLAIG